MGMNETDEERIESMITVDYEDNIVKVKAYDPQYKITVQECYTMPENIEIKPLIHKAVINKVKYQICKLRGEAELEDRKYAKELISLWNASHSRYRAIAFPACYTEDYFIAIFPKDAEGNDLTSIPLYIKGKTFKEVYNILTTYIDAS